MTQYAVFFGLYCIKKCQSPDNQWLGYFDSFFTYSLIIIFSLRFYKVTSDTKEKIGFSKAQM